MMHDRFEAMLTNKRPPPDFGISNDEGRTILALHNWIVDHNFKADAVEFVVANSKLRYAGRVDAKGMFGKRTRKRMLIDLKTSKDLRPSYFLQVADYFHTPECADCDGAILLHAQIPCDKVAMLPMNKPTLKRHFRRGCRPLHELWGWWEEFGGSRVKKEMLK